MYLYIDKIERIDLKQLLYHLLEGEEWEAKLTEALQEIGIALQRMEQEQLSLSWNGQYQADIDFGSSKRASIGAGFLQFLKREPRLLNEEEMAALACVLMFQYLEITSLYLPPHRLDREELHLINVTGLELDLGGAQAESRRASPMMFSFLRYLKVSGQLTYVKDRGQLPMKIYKHQHISVAEEEQGSLLFFSSAVYGSNISHQVEHLDPGMLLLQSNIDDMNPELLPYVMQLLFQEGANDVFLQPIIMKKGRMATMLQVLCQKSLIQKMESIIFRETSTLGIRQLPVTVHRLARETKQIETKWGRISVKIATYAGEVLQASPEFEECRAIAEQHQIPLQQVYDNVTVELERGGHHEYNREK